MTLVPSVPESSDSGSVKAALPSCRQGSRAWLIGAALLAASGLAAAVWIPPTPTKEEAPVDQAAPAALRVTIVTAGPHDLPRTLRASGTLVALEEVSIGTALQDQQIVEVLVEEGRTVVAGQVLVRLEAESLRSQSAQAQAAVARAAAAVAQAEAAYAEAQANLRRIRPLRSSGTASEQQFEERLAQADSAAAALAIARAELAQAEAQLEDTRIQLAKTEIRAPVAGLISERTARLGALAGGAEPLFRIIKDGIIELDAELPEGDLSAIAPENAVHVTVSGFAEAITGHVRMIAPKVDPQTRMGRVRISLPADPDLRVGAFARASILIDEDTVAVAVPQSAVTTVGLAASVMVVDAKGLASQRKVTIGRSADDMVEIIKGLRAGEHVVGQASAFVREGDIVQPAQPLAPFTIEADQ
jgi:HlyD family secretion protein